MMLAVAASLTEFTSTRADAAPEIAQHAQHAWDERNYKQSRQDEQDNGKQHFDASFADCGFRTQASACPQRIGITLQCLGEACAKPLALDDHCGERLDVLDSRPLDKLRERPAPILARLDLHD